MRPTPTARERTYMGKGYRSTGGDQTTLSLQLIMRSMLQFQYAKETLFAPFVASQEGKWFKMTDNLIWIFYTCCDFLIKYTMREKRDILLDLIILRCLILLPLLLRTQAYVIKRAHASSCTFYLQYFLDSINMENLDGRFCRTATVW